MNDCSDVHVNYHEAEMDCQARLPLLSKKTSERRAIRSRGSVPTSCRFLRIFKSSVVNPPNSNVGELGKAQVGTGGLQRVFAFNLETMLEKAGLQSTPASSLSAQASGGALGLQLLANCEERS